MGFPVRDSITIWFSLSHFKNLSCNPPAQLFHTYRHISGFKGLHWSLRLFYHMGPQICVKIGMSIGSVKATGTVTVGDKDKAFETVFGNSDEQKIGQLFNCYGVDEQFCVSLDIEFDIPKINSPCDLPILNVFYFVADADADVQFRFTEGDIKIHRGFLSLISPVFQAMFSHDTKEAITGVVNITDFNLATVTNVINLCYGRAIEAKPISEVIDMVRFADKYDINALVEHLENTIGSTIDNDNFCVVAQFAWDLDRNHLQMACAEHYRKNPSLSLISEFSQMSAPVQLGVIAGAASSD